VEEDCDNPGGGPRRLDVDPDHIDDESVAVVVVLSVIEVHDADDLGVTTAELNPVVAEVVGGKAQVPEERDSEAMASVAVVSVGLTFDDQLLNETDNGERFTLPGVM